MTAISCLPQTVRLCDSHHHPPLVSSSLPNPPHGGDLQQRWRHVFDCFLLVAKLRCNVFLSLSIFSQHYAARNGHEEICKRLLRKGANVNAATRSGTTPLHRAAYCGHTSVVKLLLKHGAKPDLCDSDAQNALHKVSCQVLCSFAAVSS